MIGSMNHERFYSSGIYSAPELGVYGGSVTLHQSFVAGRILRNEENDIVLIFSGECFPEKRNLEKEDWLIDYYQEQGDRFFENLNGIFSGLLIDKRQKLAFLFNDRFGFDRIYFAETKNAFFFASEAKAILQILPDSRTFSSEGVSEYLALGCPINGHTLFRGINLLPGGSVWSFDGRDSQRRSYFSPSTWESQAVLSEGEFALRFQEIFKGIVPRYFDSKVGISLTAGLDSRMLMACRPEVAQPPVCYTFTGSYDTLDARLAGRVARACGYEHHSIPIKRDFLSDFAAHVDRTVYLTDGSFGLTGAHEVYLNQAARALSPVRLTGVFGGEVLREVSTFKPLKLDPALLDPAVAREVSDRASQFTAQETHPVTFAAFKEVPWNLFGSAAASRSQVTFRTPYLDNELVALAYRIPSRLRRSDDPAIELVNKEDPSLGRIPTDMALLGSAGGLQRAWRRIFERATFKLDYLANDGLPHWLSPLDPALDRLNSAVGLLGRHKYLHYRRWFRRELSEYIEETLGGGAQLPFWNRNFIGQLARRHIEGRRNYLQEINAVITLNAVNKLLLVSRDQLSAPRATTMVN